MAVSTPGGRHGRRARPAASRSAAYGYVADAASAFCRCLCSIALGLGIVPASAADYVLATGQSAVGEVGYVVTRYEDTLPDIARIYDLGFTQLMAANRGVDPWLPGAGRRIALPNFYLLPDAPRAGIVVNLAQQRLFHFPPGGGHVETYPIGVGVAGRSTPLGSTRINRKEARPTWYPPPSIRAEHPELPAAAPPGPENPLGAFALFLGRRGFLIHGTNKPDGVGRDVSHGCLHLYAEDMERLFQEIPVGTPVRVINQEAEIAWVDRELYVQIHPNKSQADEIDVTGALTTRVPPDLASRVAAAAGDRVHRIDWEKVRRAGIERTGLPVLVTSDSADRVSRTP